MTLDIQDTLVECPGTSGRTNLWNGDHEWVGVESGQNRSGGTWERIFRSFEIWESIGVKDEGDGDGGNLPEEGEETADVVSVYLRGQLPHAVDDGVLTQRSMEIERELREREHNV